MTDQFTFIETGDTELMSRSAQGDHRSFEWLVVRHQDAIVRFLGRLGAGEEADDLAQETFIRLYKQRRNYTPTGKFTTYLYTIARNVFADYCRKASRTVEQAELTLADDIPSEALPACDLSMDIEQALARLSDRLRPVIVLRILEGFTAEETGEILGIPTGTVKSRLHLGFREMRKHLEIYERNYP